MKDEEGSSKPQINMSKIPVGGGIAGGLFAGISMAIFLIGIPAIRAVFPVVLAVGGGIALVLHSMDKRAKIPGQPWINQNSGPK